MANHPPSVTTLYLDQLLDAQKIGPAFEEITQTLWTQQATQISSQLKRFFRLARRYSPPRLEAACKRALYYHDTTFQTLSTILSQNLDLLPLDPRSDLYGQRWLPFCTRSHSQELLP